MEIIIYQDDVARKLDYYDLMSSFNGQRLQTCQNTKFFSVKVFFVRYRNFRNQQQDFQLLKNVFLFTKRQRQCVYYNLVVYTCIAYATSRNCLLPYFQDRMIVNEGKFHEDMCYFLNFLHFFKFLILLGLRVYPLYVSGAHYTTLSIRHI